jgi:hypothetical protein
MHVWNVLNLYLRSMCVNNELIFSINKTENGFELLIQIQALFMLKV